MIILKPAEYRLGYRCRAAGGSLLMNPYDWDTDYASAQSWQKGFADRMDAEILIENAELADASANI